MNIIIEYNVESNTLWNQSTCTIFKKQMVKNFTLPTGRRWSTTRKLTRSARKWLGAEQVAALAVAPPVALTLDGQEYDREEVGSNLATGSAIRLWWGWMVAPCGMDVDRGGGWQSIFRRSPIPSPRSVTIEFFSKTNFFKKLFI